MPDGTLVEVTREVYLEWYQSRRREKYQEERKRKYNVCSLEALGEYTKGAVRSELEDLVIQRMYQEKIMEAMEQLPEEEAYLIYLLYFEEMKIKEAAQLCGCSRRTIRNRRKRILEELKNIMNSLGMTGSYF